MMTAKSTAALSLTPSPPLSRPVLSSLPTPHSPPPRLPARIGSSSSSLRATARSSLATASLLGAGCLALTTLASPASASLVGSSLQLAEPANALSLPTWAVHVSSVAEWITAMALVWQYGEVSGYESWKGLSWGMNMSQGYEHDTTKVPLLGGAFCACTWHFFYNSESLEVLVALQAVLTVIGNATMCFAAFRIYRASEERSGKL
ncbi:uncharacterized protein LOC125314412 [Rhodamnia argentea]|uniref:Uncharacterized protein LOC125314412 n=1 Tax=Rhodamnia argentea TaxID=178133 RepID=A0ABM3H7C2_9MYRT|nr:uncharacterized protein LOC125314412 [Rhodamnia argentea]